MRNIICGKAMQYPESQGAHPVVVLLRWEVEFVMHPGRVIVLPPELVLPGRPPAKSFKSLYSTVAVIPPAVKYPPPPFPFPYPPQRIRRQQRLSKA